MNGRATNQRALGTTRPAASSAAMLAKSVVCVALVAGLAWIGMSSVGDNAATDRSASEVGTPARVAITGDRAAAHRREVFEERRARFEAQSPTQVAGSLHVDYLAP